MALFIVNELVEQMQTTNVIGGINEKWNTK